MKALSLLLILAPSLVQAQSIRVDGEGYMRLFLAGRVVFARTGTLTVNQGKLGLGSATFLPAISYQGDVRKLRVELDGTVREGDVSLGQLVLGVFESAPKVAGPFFSSSDRPKLVAPGEGTSGLIRMEGVSGEKPVRGPSSIKVGPTIPSTELPEPPAGGVTISLKPFSEVAVDNVRLGDIAEFRGMKSAVETARQVSLGETPPIGVDRKFDASRIRSRLLAAGLSARSVRLVMDQTITIRRKGQLATESDFVNAAIQEIETRFGKYGQLTSRAAVADLMMPLGEKRLVVEQAGEVANGFRAVVAAYIDRQLINRRTIVLERTGVPTMPRVGEAVTVRVMANNIFVETRGRVTRVGKPGEAVEITTNDGIRLTGIVTGPGTVEVRA